MQKTFNNLDQLLDEIRQDKDSVTVAHNRFPVRFIFLYSFAVLRELISYLEDMQVERLELSECLPKDDGWLTKDHLVQIMQSIRNDSIVLPFSEIARFYTKEDFKNLFNRLAIIENSQGNFRRRIYLPLIGLKERFDRDFHEHFYRKNESAPIWELQEEHFNTVKVMIFGQDEEYVDITGIHVIPNTRAWLNLWKKFADSPFLCYANSLCFYYENALPDQIFDMKRINNKKELIEELFLLDIPISYKDFDAAYWNKLLSVIGQDGCKSFSDIITKQLNVSEIDESTLVKKWLESEDDFKKWLLKVYTLNQTDWHNKYLYKILQSLDDLSDYTFVKAIWLRIFDEEKPNKYIQQRRNLLKAVYETRQITLSKDTVDQIESKINSIEDKRKRLDLITGFLAFEKPLLINEVVNEDFGNFNLINEKFPHLYHYLTEPHLDNLKDNQGWVRGYFNEYKIAKLKNEYSTKIFKQLNEISSDKKNFYHWYYSFDQVNSILKNHMLDRLICVDAMGIEWLSLAEKILEEMGLKVEKKLVARANLPTTTEYNKQDAEYIYVRDFDQLIHAKIFQYPGTIVDQIEMIINILRKNLVLEKNKRAAIFADHGTSALARLCKRHSSKFPEAKHEGRYFPLNRGQNFRNTEEYIVHDGDDLKGENNKFVVALKHHSLNRKPTREVHGGCTPEEVLVPVIIVSTIDSPQEVIIYQVQPAAIEINPKNPVVSLSINPEPHKKPYLYRESDKKLKLEYNAQQKMWQTELADVKPGKYIYFVIVGNSKTQIKVEVSAGFKEEELF